MVIVKELVEIADLNRELQVVIKTGKVLIGSRETLKAIERKEARVVIHSFNCPEEIKKNFRGEGEEGKKKGGFVVYEYPANNIKLGLACGKPYSVASLCITEVGESEILSLLQGTETYSKAE